MPALHSTGQKRSCDLYAVNLRSFATEIIPMSNVLIIGGGVIGLLTAWELVRSGADVTLVEMGTTGCEASWAGGGIMSPLYPWRYADSVTALSLWSQGHYPQLCATLREETGIDPEFIRSGLLILDLQDQDQALAWGRKHQVRIESLAPNALCGTAPGLGPTPLAALWLPEIAQIRNPRFVKALRCLIAGQVHIREQEEVVELLLDSNRAVGARTRKATIAADRVVVCSGAWTAQLFERLGNQPDIEPVRGQMILLNAKPGLVNHMVLSRDRYLIPRLDGHILIGSTLEHQGFVKATTTETKADLHRTAMELFPALKYAPIANHWAGLRPSSPRGIPYIGAYPGIRGLYCNAGHYRTGLVTGPASARLAADLLLGRTPSIDPSPYALDADR